MLTTETKRELNRRRCRERRERLKAAGVCIFDGFRPADKPSPLCRVCRAEQNAAPREQYRRACDELRSYADPRL